MITNTRQQPERLVIDRATPLQRPSAEQIKQWSSRQRVFISSTMDDLSDARRVASETVSALGAEAVLFEKFGARSGNSRQSYKEEVRRSSIYLGILSQFYGGKLPSGYSATHEEYEEAVSHRKEILLFLDSSLPDQEREGNLNRWLKDLYQFHVLAKYTDLNVLHSFITTSLERLAGDELTPWVKLGNVIFQANKIERVSTGGHISFRVTTASRDPQVTALLGNLARDRFGNSPLWLTYSRDSFSVKVQTAEEVIDPVRGDSLMLTCETVENRWQSTGSSLLMLGGGYRGESGNYEHRDLVEIALRGLVLGEKPPKDGFFGSLPRTDFTTLHKQYGEDELIFPKILRLLIVENIYLSQIVDRIIYLSLGRVQGGRLYARFAAITPKIYSNIEPESIELEGEIDLT